MAPTLRDYQRLKQQRLAAQIPPRDLCYRCWRPGGFCYCAKIRPIGLDLRFAILIHPLEEKRPIATGRMAHLCLKDSFLIEGDDYSDSAEVNALLADPKNDPAVLFPCEGSTDLSALEPEERRALFRPGKRPLIFVIDGTWHSARRTMFRSRNLKNLPCIRFTPAEPSRIRVRHQPDRHCYTTLEAIHQTIDLLTEMPSRPHDNLLEVMEDMVGRQLVFCAERKPRDEGLRIRRSLLR
ncbi:MAG TPA: tRNA-uridine aminocarboxypropyltransferase [bacterium]|nr:tRNA-uridine aminocarboxypropyltransferase [bacterium]